MTVRLLIGDCLEKLREFADESVHCVVTDPPYHLTEGKKGGRGLLSVNLDSPHGRARVTSGFMGMKWDGGDVAFRPEVWRECARVMKPGAYLDAFGGTRTYHRLACAIEDAGFEIRDQLAWVYGSGFPKGTDKAKIPEAWRGFNTALKPAWEPIVLARKPMVGTLAENLTANGCGAMNVDGCRIAVEDDAYARNCSGDRGHDGTRSIEERGATDLRPSGGRAAEGRWYHLGSMTQGEISQKLLKSGSNMTTVIDNLERDGFVRRERDETDRRVIYVHLTKAGTGKIEAVLPNHVGALVEIFGALSPSEQETLGELCKKLGKGKELA